MKKSIDWLKKNTITIILIVLAVILTGCFEKEESKEEKPVLSGDVAIEEQFYKDEFFDKIDEMFKETTGSFSSQEIKELYKFDNVTTNDMRCYVIEDGEKYIELFVAYSEDNKELEDMIPSLIERTKVVRNQVTNENLKTELNKV